MKHISIEIEDSIRQINEILNHWTNVWKDGIPPFSPLADESVRLLKNQLEILKKCLAEKEEVRKNEFKQAGLEDNTSYQITFVQSEHSKIVFRKKFIPIIEPRLDEIGPIRFEPIRFEPRFVEIKSKRLKIKPQKKSDGWRAPNKNQRRPVCRY
jgi:hypothetical protein